MSGQTENGGMAAFGHARNPNVPKPKALKPGDTIGLIAPSGSTNDADMAAKGTKFLADLGFKVKTGKSCTAKYGYLAAPDTLRASDVNDFFADAEIDGIVCFKGGYGTPRILDALDYGLISANPKVFVGYSDITGMHLAIQRYTGMPTFHGIMAVSMVGSADRFSVDSWMRAIGAEGPLGRLDPPPGANPGPVSLVGGKARGILIGGNLSLVAALAGTPYALDPRGKILFLEDIDEEPYRLDRMLTQLRLAGVFEQCEGIVLGNWNNCGAKDPTRSLTLAEVFRDVIAPSGKPCITDFAAGHCVPTHTMPFGVEAFLDADEATLEITESATTAIRTI